MLIERVVAETLNLIFVDERSNSVEEQSNIWLGLSCGIDSTVLLHAVAHYCSIKYSSTQNGSNNSAQGTATLGRRLKAIHVHHGLSENADAWAKQAQVLCDQLALKYSITIDCIIEKVQLDNRGDGLEQVARSARYQVFSKHCGPNDVLLQGHHLDDQIETFFMRAIRGSGLTGLASIPKQRNLSRDNTCQILRPLLTIEKNDLIEYAKDHQLNWVEDESNQDSKIDRNWWRNELLPKIWQHYPKQKQALSRTINTIQHEQRLLQQLIINKIVSNDELQSPDHKTHSALKNIPRFNLLLIQSMDQAKGLSYLRAWFAQYVDILPTAIQMQTIYVDMILARVDSEPQFSGSAFSLYRYHNGLYLFAKVDTYSIKQDQIGTDSLNIDLLNDRSLEWQGQELELQVELLNCFLGQLVCHTQVGAFALIPSQYKVRHWQAGDVAKPAGRSTRKMKKWWQDYHVPSWVRESWPIIVNNETDEIAAVPGLFVCHGYCVEQGELGWLVEYKLDFK
jgi:tRNA(Ile)-lysidine synthase